MNRMKAFTIVTWTGVVAILLAAASMAEAGPVAARQRNQQMRIAHGVASGSLTVREATRLELRHMDLGRDSARMRATGDGLGPCERAIIDHRQDHLSGAIWRQQHDGQRRH
jgi:hypothetical protein